MNYEAAELEIVNWLNEQFALNGVANLYEAALIPQTENEARTFYNTFSKARIAVGLIDLVPQPSTGGDIVTQEEIVRFRLTFEARKLRGAGGLYALIKLAKICLIGYRLTDAINKLSLSKYGLLDFEQNGIQPYYEFECKIVNTQWFNDNPDDVPFGDGPTKIEFPADVYENA